MTIHFENESGVTLGIDPEELARQVISEALEQEGCPFETDLNLLITDSEQIREMNRSFREIDRTTDVLSFPMLEFETPGDFSFLQTEEGGELFDDADRFDPESGELLLGDIVVNAERVLSQAEEYGHSVKREYAFLIAHSMLHLMGYDHERPEEAEQMEKRQEAILQRLSITRDEITRD